MGKAPAGLFFYPDYQCKLGSGSILATDLSEQISTGPAGGFRHRKYEICHEWLPTIGTSTGRMWKFREQWGSGELFLFGKTTEEIESLGDGGYRPWTCIGWRSPNCRRCALDQARSFHNGDVSCFKPLLGQPHRRDPFFLFADSHYRSRPDAAAPLGGLRANGIGVAAESRPQRATSPRPLDVRRVRHRALAGRCLPRHDQLCHHGIATAMKNSDSIG